MGRDRDVVDGGRRVHGIASDVGDNPLEIEASDTGVVPVHRNAVVCPVRLVVNALGYDGGAGGRGVVVRMRFHGTSEVDIAIMSIVA